MNAEDGQPSGENTYLEQVLKQKSIVGQELQHTTTSPSAENAEKEPLRAVEYRITGFWRWKTVLVPPNAYVVHTRRGHADPLHLGLGESFRFNPFTDSFLVIPAAMQTIVINANCICRERQGIMVQAYVQWIIDDIGTAYRRLDFSDPADPMRIVNVQLREQAEAAIKDKVATMAIDDVLSDKQTIIEELTHRLREVAESRDGGGGLGLKIVTVQIKEAVVSSGKLWENLQTPFRVERQKIARMAELRTQRELSAKELEFRKESETRSMEVESELDQLRNAKEQERYDRERGEKTRRHRMEQEREQLAITERNATAHAKSEGESALAIAKLGLEVQRLNEEAARVEAKRILEESEARRSKAGCLAELDLAGLRHGAAANARERDLGLLRLEREIENAITDEHLRARLIERLPEIAEAMPTPEHLKSISISDGNGGAESALIGFVGSIIGMLQKDVT
jgi:flotillin